MIEYLINDVFEVIEGVGGDYMMFVVVVKVKDLGVIEDEVVELMLEYWYEGCGWMLDDFVVKVVNVYWYGVNLFGVDVFEVVFEFVLDVVCIV